MSRLAQCGCTVTVLGGQSRTVSDLYQGFPLRLEWD